MSTTRELATLVAMTLALSGCYLDLGGTEEPEPEAPVEPPESCWNPPVEGPKPTPESQVTLTARVLRDDGTPATGSVAIEDPMTLSDLFWAIGTLGLTCLIDDPAGPNCGHLEVRALDAQGRFDYSVGEDMTHGSLLGLEYHKRFGLLAVAPEQTNGFDGAILQAELILPTQQVSLPDLRLWEPGLAVTHDAGRLSIGFATPPELACMTREEPSLEFSDEQRTLLWTQTAGPVDARMLEDFVGSAAVALAYDNQESGAIERLRLTSPKAPFTGTAGPPPSRGAACRIGAQQFSAGLCPLTDGALLPSSESDPSAVVELAAERQVSLVVVRGSAIAGARLEASLEGQTWTELSPGLKADLAVVELPAAVSLRQVRLTKAQDSSLFVSEISVW